VEFGPRALEILVNAASTAWAGRPVFVTGHTGFKGGWLSVWLNRLGARVHGYALDPLAPPCLFEVARVASLLASDVRADIADLAQLEKALRAAMPEVVFHLAAQPLVRESYRDPLGTLRTNVMGTANVLQLARSIPSIRAVVVVTTDKVYENHETRRPYFEDDPLGGHDPYSASKAAAEIVSASFRSSFFGNTETHIATARAGNVIGGGDWAQDRLVPDCLRAFAKGDAVELRNPTAVRPWQHVLEPIAGYVQLAEKLLSDQGRDYAKAWNFGPRAADNADVQQVAQALAQQWGEGATVRVTATPDQPHEAHLLMLDSTRAHTALGWQPRWPLDTALANTVAWQRAWLAGADMREVCEEQLAHYASAGAA